MFVAVGEDSLWLRYLHSLEMLMRSAVPLFYGLSTGF